jgi:hypothetical protein
MHYQGNYKYRPSQQFFQYVYSYMHITATRFGPLLPILTRNIELIVGSYCTYKGTYLLCSLIIASRAQSIQKYTNIKRNLLNCNANIMHFRCNSFQQLIVYST